MGYYWQLYDACQDVTTNGMTAPDAIDHLFSLIWGSSLKSNLKGVVRRYFRPTNSRAEEVTINILNGDFEQLQSGIFPVNVYVPNPDYSAIVDGRNVTMRDIPDQTRIKVLAALCEVVLKMHYDKKKHVLVELVNQIILPEAEQTIINNRVKLTIKNL